MRETNKFKEQKLARETRWKENQIVVGYQGQSPKHLPWNGAKILGVI